MDISKVKILKKLYYDPASSSAFASIKGLHREANRYSPFTLKEVRKWLRSQLTYSLHKPRRKTFKRNPVVVSKPFEQYQADLVDVQSFSKYNNGFKYILTVIDVFSKFAFALPVKDKTANSVISAFKQILAENQPEKLQTDNGKEFVNKHFKAFLKARRISFFTTNDKYIKCSVVERFNRTLKARMWKYFTSSGEYKWIDVLEKLVYAYNHSIHRSINGRPVDVTEQNADLVFRNLYGFSSLRDMLRSFNKQRRKKYETGNLVRIQHDIGPLEKSYYPQWTDRVYKINKSIDSLPRQTVKLEENKKKFYPEEIQLVDNEDYRIEKILQTRGKGKRKEFLISWLGYPDTFNSWQSAQSIRILQNG